MAMQLSALRVDASFDASDYVRGLNAKVAADKAATDSSTQLSTAIDQTNTKLSSRAFINGNGAVQQFQQQMEAARRQQEQLNASLNGLAPANDNATRSGHGLATVLGEVATVAGVAGKAIGFLATSGVAQFGILGGSAALFAANFRNSVAANVAEGVAGTLSALALPLRAFAALALAVEVMDKITQLGIEHMKELVDIAGQADKAGVSASFFQTETKAAQDFTVSADSATKALTDFNAATVANAPGTSSLDKAIQAARDAGNFIGNAGVAQYQAANSTEEKWAAVVTLITQAMQQGQRLAALDLASKFLPADIMTRLRASGDFLQQWQQTATNATPLFTDDEVSRAVRINAELTAAQTTLATKWQPIMTDLASLGMQWEESWVGVLRLLARASELIGTLYADVKAIAATPIGSGALNALAHVIPGLGMVVDALRGVSTLTSLAAPPASNMDLTTARGQLAAGLSNPANVLRAQLQATNVEMRVLGDTSKQTATETEAIRDAWDRLTTQLERHVLANQADVLSIGQSQAATAGLKAEFDLLEAAMVANRGVTSDQIQQYVSLRGAMEAHQSLVAAGIALNATDAATFDRVTTAIQQTTAALEKARADEQIRFSGSLLGLNDNDIAIARQLKQLFGDDVSAALASSEASALRIQKTIGDWKGYAADFTGALLSGLQQGQTMAQALSQALVSATNNVASNFGKLGTQDLYGGLLSGSLSGIATGGVGVGIGAVVSLFTGAYEQEQQAKQQWQQAQQDWANMAQEVANWSQQMAGGGQGSVTNALQQATQQAQQYADAAHKAGQGADEINKALDQFAIRTVRDFISTFDLMVGSLNAGFGFDSPALQAAQNVKSIGDQLKGFVTDTITVAATIGGNAAALQAASTAAQAYALSLLQTPPALTDIETKYLNLMGTAAQLSSVLQDLGMSSQQAAQEIQAGLNTALAALRDEFSNTLQRSINSATGKDYLNQLQDLIDESAKNLADAQLLGVDPALVAQAFQAQAQAIIDSANLTGDAFDNLIHLFPQLANVVSASSQAIQQQIEYYQQLQLTIQKYLASLQIGSLSPLSPGDQLAAAQQNWQQQLALAQSGNRDALDSITDVANALLNTAQSYYASSGPYADIYQQVTQALQDLVPTAQANDPLTQIADNTATTNEILNVLQTLNQSTTNSSTTIAQAIQQLGAQSQALGVGQSSNYFGPMTGYLATIATNTATSGQAASEPHKNVYWYNPFTWFHDGGIVGRYDGGGIVGNGIWNMDSVRARYAGGGDILLGGGEHVTRATSVNGNTMPTLDFINRTGRLPANDNGAHFEALGNVITQAIAAATMAQIATLRDQVGLMVDRLDGVERAIKAQKRPERLGSRKAA